jgi:hypothetical protein
MVDFPTPASSMIEQIRFQMHDRNGVWIRARKILQIWGFGAGVERRGISGYGDSSFILRQRQEVYVNRTVLTLKLFKSTSSKLGLS